MFNNKNLELASYGHLDYYYFISFLGRFENASLVNLNGDLLFSKDGPYQSTITSRLVSYQIVKRYLKLHPGDIFITNDPENGGYNYSKIFFISALTHNLFLIWCEDLNHINFKIPLSPLTESNKINQMLWSAMIEPHPLKEELSNFFNTQIENFLSCFNAKPYLTFLSEPDFQQIWFNTCYAEYSRQFDLKAHGQSHLNIKNYNQTLKTSLAIEEKPNSKQITIDFSGTQLADKISAASHVIESALMQEIVKSFHLEVFLSQPILNQIKLIMPPKSLVSKPHPLGDYNFEFQSLVQQVLRHLFQKINSTSRKELHFHLRSEAHIEISDQTLYKFGYFLDSTFHLEPLHDMLSQPTMFMKENLFTSEFYVREGKTLQLKTHLLKSENEKEYRHIMINEKEISTGTYTLKPQDKISFKWKID